jgi:hypothetical protein
LGEETACKIIKNYMILYDDILFFLKITVSFELSGGNRSGLTSRTKVLSAAAE